MPLTRFRPSVLIIPTPQTSQGFSGLSTIANPWHRPKSEKSLLVLPLDNRPPDNLAVGVASCLDDSIFVVYDDDMIGLVIASGKVREAQVKRQRLGRYGLASQYLC